MTDALRSLLDEDLSQRTAQLLRSWGIDAISSHECGRDGWRDEAQLRAAAGEGRCLVTRDARHFSPLSRRFFESEWPHAGVLLIPRSIHEDDFVGLARAIAAYARAHAAADLAYTVDWLTPSPAAPDD